MEEITFTVSLTAQRAVETGHLVAQNKYSHANIRPEGSLCDFLGNEQQVLIITLTIW